MLWYFNLVSGFYPVFDACGAGLIGDSHADRAVKQLGGIEAVVYLLVLQQAVGVNARTGNIKILADKRIIIRDFKTELFSGVLGKLGYRCIADTFSEASQLGVLDHHRLQRWVSCPLTDAEYGAVGCATAVEPRCYGVYLDLVQVVVAVPLQPFARHANLSKPVNKLGDAAGQRRISPRQAEAKRIAKTNLNRPVVLFGNLHQLGGER